MTYSYNTETVDFFANKCFINMYSKHIMEGQRKKNESYNENLCCTGKDYPAMNSFYLRNFQDIQPKKHPGHRKMKDPGGKKECPRYIETTFH